MSLADESTTVPELLAMYDDGSITEGELHAAVFARLTEMNVASVIAALPDERRVRFVAWARRRYDNELDASMFVGLGGEGTIPTPDEAFEAIRGWFASQPRSC